MTDTGHLYITWEKYHRLIEQLALVVHDSNWEFDHIICIARGGLRVGDQLSRIFDKPLAIMSTSSYVAEGGTVRGKLLVSEHLTMTSATLGARVLVVDDMVDSGHTLHVVKEELPRRYAHLTEVRTAVIWKKGISTFHPDYFVDYLPASPWIHQPFEHYDTTRPSGLSR
ncbi:MAG: phosphoribosyltransferase [Burkholderiales bacterium]|nr:MAG: phosphoribosyltransferase [Burkholderiales bacterium]